MKIYLLWCVILAPQFDYCMSLKLRLKTHSICFIRSTSQGFDYFLKGSNTITVDELADSYHEKPSTADFVPAKIIKVLKEAEVKLVYSDDSGMFYSRIEISAEFADGGVYFASGGGSTELTGVYVKGEKAVEHICDLLIKRYEPGLMQSR